MVALNFQTRDRPMMVNDAMFRGNEGTGYVLKPSVLRDLSSHFDPLSFDPNEMGCILNIRVVCGCVCARVCVSHVCVCVRVHQC